MHIAALSVSSKHRRHARRLAAAVRPTALMCRLERLSFVVLLVVRVQGNMLKHKISRNVFQTRENVEHVYTRFQNGFKPYINESVPRYVTRTTLCT